MYIGHSLGFAHVNVYRVHRHWILNSHSGLIQSDCDKTRCDKHIDREIHIDTLSEVSIILNDHPNASLAIREPL